MRLRELLLGSHLTEDALVLLGAMLEDDEPLVRDHAEWALGRLEPDPSREES